MALRNKKALKGFFESGDKPNQDAFLDLIDSFMHQDQNAIEFSGIEFVSLANSLANINAPFLRSNTLDIGNTILTLEVLQQNAENQVIELREFPAQMKQYFLGDAPYDLTLQSFQAAELGQYEYYFITYNPGPDRTVSRLFGNNLPMLTEGFNFGAAEGFCTFELSKLDLGEEINVLNTNIKFINDTGVLVKYMSRSEYWQTDYIAEDSTTEHHTPLDYVVMYCIADMSKETDSIEISFYNDDDNGELLDTHTLMPGTNYTQPYGIAASAEKVRNVRIECTKK